METLHLKVYLEIGDLLMNRLRPLHLLIICICLPLLITSCSYNTQVIPSSYTNVFKLLRNNLIQKDDAFVDYNLIENIPYASLLFNFRSSSQSLLILETEYNDKSRWVSADSKTITIQEGRIIETLGFPNDLLKVKASNLSFKEIINSNQVSNSTAYYSFKKPDLYNLKVKLETRSLGLINVAVSGKVKNLYLIEEIISSKKINWVRKNKYWVDPKDYFVWKSEQDISPRLPRIFITVTKKPAI